MSTVLEYYKRTLPVTLSSRVRFMVPLKGFSSIRTHSTPSGDLKIGPFTPESALFLSKSIYCQMRAKYQGNKAEI